MTKFEEELKRPKKAYIDQFSKRDVDFTGVAKKFTEGAQTLKEWKEYAFLLEDKLKLQQQSLPVVPEWLDIEIKHFKSTSKHPTVDVVFGVADAIVAVKNGNTHSKLYDYLFCGKQDVCNQHQATFALAFITGKYQVEKPQLFYLKNKITGNVLVYDESPELSEVSELFATGGEFELENYTFTQSEIDSMETGSYEQIEVEE